MENGTEVELCLNILIPVKVVWATEESDSIGSLEKLDLYPWEEIVSQILKQKQILPTMIGLHKDLDELIETELGRKS